MNAVPRVMNDEPREDLLCIKEIHILYVRVITIK